MLNRNTQFKKGFTLIELIVVIAIIGLLASVVLASLGLSRTRAEISKVLIDYKSVANGLELYRQSHNGTYPGVPADPAIPVSDLVGSGNPLAEYVNQAPSISPAVVASGDVNYYLNPVDDDAQRIWCGDKTSNQDYVISFIPTVEAINSGLFHEVYDSLSDDPLSDVLCISVNQK
ncbi:MAG: type II secretion system protein [Candidatus Pacebacteria bacterium]|nr:type II secretion system protein [Candidatus Paceibacterota bacterium]